MTTEQQTQGSPLEPLAELKKLQDYFSEAEAKLQDGVVVNMTGVDQHIAAVCQIVQQSDPAQQMTYLPELTALIDRLGRYENELRRVQALVAAEGAKDGHAES